MHSLYPHVCKTFLTHSISQYTHLLILQVLNLGRVVSVSLTVAQHFEAGHSNGVDHGPPIGEELDIPDLQHAAIVSETLQLISDAHAKPLGSGLHGAADHEAVAWFEDVQWTGDGGEGHGAHKDWYFLVQARV